MVNKKVLGEQHADTRLDVENVATDSSDPNVFCEIEQYLSAEELTSFKKALSEQQISTENLLLEQKAVAEQRAETHSIIEELLEDGSDPNALYEIEHHFSAKDFKLLEKAAIVAFKLGYEVHDSEELEIEDGTILMCCDVYRDSALDAELIDKQVVQLMMLTEKIGINYDGWGTFFEDPNYDDAEEKDVEPKALH